MSFNIENYFNGQNNDNVILHYKGNIDSDIINRVLDTVEDKMVEINEQSKLRKKVYNVLVESLQNLYHHADKVPNDFEDQTSERYGLLVVKKVDNGYLIITGDFVDAEKREKLEEKIIRINQSTKEEIKELYKFILNHQKISAKGGGGLGLVDIARKTGHKLDYSFVNYNSEYSFFYLNILVNNEEN
jgi:hypothetical protein